MERVVLNKDTLVPISFVVMLFAGMFWMSNKFTAIQIKLDQMERKIDDQWSATEMENWSLKLKLANPDIEIPEVR